MRVSWDLKGKSDVPGRARDGGDGPGTPGSESGKRESQGREQRHSLTQSILGECPLCPRHCAGPGNQAVTSMDRKAELELRRRRQSIRDGESLPHFSDPKGSWRIPSKASLSRHQEMIVHWIHHLSQSSKVVSKF